ncbi:hypothetical protein E1B28_008491 [Marasmius oreades]|uniref:Uncharacterized protein n=1 Tax=Marasmius oreades TaxID=181124 RepID=A0A9P7URU1_9AGAR|nr:uncharacterized protein E1B28_008491 [Marasmius oreades]KAG7092117.1 hypothetical protein E1B28_008491 [Marasmius oreades]
MARARAEAWCGLTITTGAIGLVLWLSTPRCSDYLHDQSQIKFGSGSAIQNYDFIAETAALIIILGVTESGIALFHALLQQGIAEKTVVSLACGFSFISWMWARVLLSYHRRPFARRTLTRPSTHFCSLAVLELVVALMVLSRTTKQCNLNIQDDHDFCWVRGVTGGLSMAH